MAAWLAGRPFRAQVAAHLIAEDQAERMAEALERAHAAERVKTVFLARMSHEMRTPLNGILGMADALAGTHLKVPQRELLEVIRIQALALDALIADLLAASRCNPADEARMAELFASVVHADAGVADRDYAVRAPPVATAAGPCVLIVDDNRTNRKVLELILEQLGVCSRSVENGRQAVDAVRDQDFAAILMDIQMPVMDGLTATRQIRGLERAAGRPDTPVIIVSANGQPEHIQAGQAAGAQGHIAKPVSAEALAAALNAVLEQGEGEDVTDVQVA